jgi:hypothetical protein
VRVRVRFHPHSRVKTAIYFAIPQRLAAGRAEQLQFPYQALPIPLTARLDEFPSHHVDWWSAWWNPSLAHHKEVQRFFGKLH